MMSKPSGVSFSYLLTVGVVSFTRYSLLPWCLWNLNQRKHDSWTKVVPAYGFLLASLQSGHALGQMLINLNVTSSSLYSTAFCLLTSSYIFLCFVDRYSLLIGIFFTLGFSGSLLSGVSINLDKSVSNIAFVRKPTDVELNNSIQRSIISFAFSTIISGYLYDPNPAVHFPLYRIMIMVTTACLLMSFYFCCINRVVRKKYKSQNSMSSSSSSPSTVTSGDSDKRPTEAYTGEVPPNFMSFCHNNVAKAQAAYGKCLAWRRDEGIDDIFNTPQQSQEGFHNTLKFYPHAIHGYSLAGYGVVYELLGKGDASKLKASGVSVKDLLTHFNLRNELCFERLLTPEILNDVATKYPGSIVPGKNPRPSVKRIMVVLDVQGLNPLAVNSDVLSFIAQNGAIMDNYYPEQVAHLVIVNTPYFFGAIWSVIAKVLPVSIQQKVDILKDVKDLDKYIHTSQRPQAYGGTSVELGQAEGHKEFLKIAESWKNYNPTNSQTSKMIKSSGNNSSKDTHKAVNDAVQTGKTGGSSGGSGMMGWFKSKMTKSSTPKEAFLGNKNSYRYNATTGVWELEFDESNSNPAMDEADDCDTVITFDQNKRNNNGSSSSSSSGGGGVVANTSLIMNTSATPSTVTHKKIGTASSSGASSSSTGGQGHHKSSRLTAAQIDEHGLILAIQAAHVAKSYSSDNISGMTTSDFSSLESGTASTTNISNNDASSGGSGTGAVHSQHTDIVHGRVSSDIFMMVGGIHLLSAALYTMFTVLLPVWLMSQVSHGGLGYRVKDLSIVLSTTAMIVLQFHVLLSSRLEYCLKASPVRTLRIACGVLVSMCFVLPLYLNITTYDTSYGLSQTSALISSTNIPVESVLAEESILVHHDYHTHLLSNVNHNLPTHSVITLCLTSLLIAITFSASYVCRKSTNILFHLTLHSSFTSPTTMRCIVNQIIDIIAPILATLLYSVIYGMKLRYPMNSSFFLSIMSSGFILVYMCSILLTVNFRGDYGVMTDTPNSSVSNSVVGVLRSSSKDFGNNQLRSRHTSGINNSTWNNGNNRFNSNNNNNGMSDPSQDVFSIPMGDLNLLFSQIAYSYGSKLHNLRDDFKDL